MSSELRAGIVQLPAARADARSEPAPDAAAPPGAVGQLRALCLLGKLDQVFAISAVSGGTWAHSVFTYLPEGISDDEFLGPPVLDPGQLMLRTGPHALDSWNLASDSTRGNPQGQTNAQVVSGMFA